jgi:hypothetical protein
MRKSEGQILLVRSTTQSWGAVKKEKKREDGRTRAANKAFESGKKPSNFPLTRYPTAPTNIKTNLASLAGLLSMCRAWATRLFRPIEERSQEPLRRGGLFSRRAERKHGTPPLLDSHEPSTRQSYAVAGRPEADPTRLCLGLLQSQQFSKLTTAIF